ncbi:GNAT family N-acetyltransferase [Streptomyces sp. ID38640]|uniref:GNAT family N-acetyltransferase n=1 Tax=Streptomyces sp. ID38640 TaxID=1265399 RepID=UPI00140EB189|nr:GNAT family N-acetyltransferase [Streptomyces sp. ID38640]QIK05901.1 GNAT family N-acetyltransferase [Streptomyces sp. ID38640]
MIIQVPALGELPALRAIERAAGEPFRALGMPSIADDEPPSLEQLTEFQRAGRVLAAYEEPGPGGEGRRPVGYLLWEPVDGCTHIEQVSVHPDQAHRRIGRALIDRAMGVPPMPSRQWGRDGGPVPLTLTTFTEVPWNAPYYARIGFRILPEAELTPGLRAIRAHEATLGLDRWPRAAMRREPGWSGRPG